MNDSAHSAQRGGIHMGSMGKHGLMLLPKEVWAGMTVEVWQDGEDVPVPSGIDDEPLTLKALLGGVAPIRLKLLQMKRDGTFIADGHGNIRYFEVDRWTPDTRMRPLQFMHKKAPAWTELLVYVDGATMSVPAGYTGKYRSDLFVVVIDGSGILQDAGGRGPVRVPENAVLVPFEEIGASNPAKKVEKKIAAQPTCIRLSAV